MGMFVWGFAQKIRNSTDEVGGWLILNILSSWRNGTNTTDEVGGFFIPDLHANTIALEVGSLFSDHSDLVRPCMNNPPTPSMGFVLDESLEYVG